MKIQESTVSLSSRHEESHRLEVTSQGEHTFHTLFRTLAGTGKGDAMGEREKQVRLLKSLVDAILAAIAGKKCRKELAGLGAGQVRLRAVGQVEEWHWQRTETVSEHERTQVEGGGSIKTADGRSIDFSLKLDLCRDYRCERTFADGGKAVLHDPLVINFDGNSAQLRGERIEFDLDGDGQLEGVPGLGRGSGYLVLDRNGNGLADNGTELFGTRSGNGFGELAELDADGNGWLDAADPAFGELRVWHGGGGQELRRLEDEGIGALWLGSVDSPFALKDGENRILGEIRATGVYLREDGRVGSLQQVDLAVTPKVEK